MHVWRWDLDRTYLDTDIHSVRGMVKAAFEPASAKRHMPGAAALLRSLLAHDALSVAAVLSGSPTQMRAVLAEKLALDGIRVESMVLKDNLSNLRRGRLRAIRGQVGYKLPHLLAQRLSRRPEDTESLFGDDAEVDALIYSVYAAILADRLDAAQVAAIMTAGGAYPDQVEHALRSMERLTRCDAVEDIYIHVDRAMPLCEFDRLGASVRGGRIRVVFSWIQAALHLTSRGRLGDDGLNAVALAVLEEDALGPAGMAALFQDAVRRSIFPVEDLDRLLSAAPALDAHATAIRRSVDALERRVHVPSSPQQPDWTGFLRAATEEVVAGRTSRG